MKAYLSIALTTLLLGVLLAALHLHWLGGDAHPHQHERTLRIGYSIEPPYSMLERSGRVTGESPEVLRAVLEKIGIRHTQWLYSDFGSLLDELEAGRIDLIASGMFITPERHQRALFTRPTLQVAPGLLTLPGNPHQLTSMLDLPTRPELRLTVLDGSVELQQARLAGVRQVLPMPDVRSAMQAVLLGDADALALSEPTLRHYAASIDTPFEIFIDTPRARQHGMGATAFVLRQQDEQLLQELDRALQRYLGSPAHQQLLQRLAISSNEGLLP